jgi:hypothetical protein
MIAESLGLTKVGRARKFGTKGLGDCHNRLLGNCRNIRCSETVEILDVELAKGGKIKRLWQRLSGARILATRTMVSMDTVLYIFHGHHGW